MLTEMNLEMDIRYTEKLLQDENKNSIIFFVE